MRLASAALLSAFVVSACLGHNDPPPPMESVAIMTEPQRANACMEALITGRLVAHPQWGLALQSPGGDDVMRPMFPFGYTAARQGDVIGLFDENGAFVAQTGDTIQSSGGSLGVEGNPVVALCDDTIEVVEG